MSQVWRIVVRPYEDLPDFGQGYALADTEVEAIAMSGCPHTLAAPRLNQEWPGALDQRFFWTRTPPASWWFEVCNRDELHNSEQVRRCLQAGNSRHG